MKLEQNQLKQQVAVSSFVLCGLGRVPGLAPAGEVLVLCFATGSPAEEKYPKERRPCCPCPYASLRAACDARAGRGLAKLAALKQTRALIRPPLRFSARPEGIWYPKNQTTEHLTGHRCARPVQKQVP